MLNRVSSFLSRPAGSAWVALAGLPMLALIAAMLLPLFAGTSQFAAAQFGTTGQTPSDDKAEVAEKPTSALFPETIKDTTALTPDGTLYIDSKNKALFVRAHVVFTAGLLEMLCCPVQTKEHESILSTPCPPRMVHAGLLALGAETGKPAQFGETFQPPTGEDLTITLLWKDEDGELQSQAAREWIRTATRRYFTAKLPQLPEGLKLPEEEKLRYDSVRNELLHYGVVTPELREKFLKLTNDPAFHKAVKELEKTSQPSTMDADWVFVGSSFQEDPDSNTPRYLADGGDFICVANFPAATIDVAVRSSASDSERGYEAFTENIPEMGTPVLIKIQRTADLAKGGETPKDR